MHKQSRPSLLVVAVLVAWAAGNIFSADMESQEVINARQETQISTTYALNPYLHTNDLKVTAKNGTITLQGTVEESVNKDLARQIALGVNGVKDVDNQIVIQSDYQPAKASTMRRFAAVTDDASTTTVMKSVGSKSLTL
jgi:osmotically-inducible protein OsmY